MLARVLKFFFSLTAFSFFSGLAWLSLQSYQLAIDSIDINYSDGVLHEVGNDHISAPFNVDWYRSAAVRAASLGDYEASLELIERGVAYRPTWPYDRLFLAHALAMNSTFDERMSRALSGIEKYGVAERTLQYDASVFLLAHWYQISEAQRKFLLPGLVAVLEREREARQLFFEIERLRRDQLFCRRLRPLVDYGDAWCSYFRSRAESRRSDSQ